MLQLLVSFEKSQDYNQWFNGLCLDGSKMTFDNSNPIWEPFIKPEEGVEYKCTTCFDYGGLLALNTIDNEGLPFMQSCPDCKGPQQDDY